VSTNKRVGSLFLLLIRIQVSIFISNIQTAGHRFNIPFKEVSWLLSLKDIDQEDPNQLVMCELRGQDFELVVD
jgi:hypothetical protein